MLIYPPTNSGKLTNTRSCITNKQCRREYWRDRNTNTATKSRERIVQFIQISRKSNTVVHLKVEKLGSFRLCILLRLCGISLALLEANSQVSLQIFYVLLIRVIIVNRMEFLLSQKDLSAEATVTEVTGKTSEGIKIFG